MGILIDVNICGDGTYREKVKNLTQVDPELRKAILNRYGGKPPAKSKLMSEFNIHKKVVEPLISEVFKNMEDKKAMAIPNTITLGVALELVKKRIRPELDVQIVDVLEEYRREAILKKMLDEKWVAWSAEKTRKKEKTFTLKPESVSHLAETDVSIKDQLTADFLDGSYLSTKEIAKRYEGGLTASECKNLLFYKPGMNLKEFYDLPQCRMLREKSWKYCTAEMALAVRYAAKRCPEMAKIVAKEYGVSDSVRNLILSYKIYSDRVPRVLAKGEVLSIGKLTFF